MLGNIKKRQSKNHARCPCNSDVTAGANNGRRQQEKRERSEGAREVRRVCKGPRKCSLSEEPKNFTVQRPEGKSLKNNEDHMMQSLVKWKR